MKPLFVDSYTLPINVGRYKISTHERQKKLFHFSKMVREETAGTISLLNTTYKIYSKILGSWLRMQSFCSTRQTKRFLPRVVLQWQYLFDEMGDWTTIENLFNFETHIAFFDFETASDQVDQHKLVSNDW